MELPYLLLVHVFDKPHWYISCFSPDYLKDYESFDRHFSSFIEQVDKICK